MSASGDAGQCCRDLTGLLWLLCVIMIIGGRGT
eukprot:COSAG02_NODE_28903_length_580_cov_0.565489_1_plen_32_part_10